MTKLIAQISFFQEPDHHLERLIKSLAGIVDFAVFVDGAYKEFPHEDHNSDLESCWTIQQLCAEHNLEIVLSHAPGAAWKSQSYKRSCMWETAMMYADPFEDYMLIIDADEELRMTSVPRSLFRISTYKPDVVKVALNTPEPATRKGKHKGTHSPRNSTSIHGKGVPRIFRAFPDTWIDPKWHGQYLAKREDGETICLKDRGREHVNDEHQPKILDLAKQIEIVNHTWERDDARLQAKHTYGKRREQLGVDL